MKTRIIRLCLPLALFLTSGCSINHFIAEDYGQYLVNGQGTKTFPKTSLQTDYFIDKKTQDHRYEFRAASVGQANLWIVEFGKMLDTTLKSTDVQAAFARLSGPTDPGVAKGNLVTFSLRQYRFENYHAYVTMDVILSKGGATVFNKTYNVEGGAQAGKMWMGGAFAMRNAIHKSTKLAIDEILSRFIEDVNRGGAGSR